MINIYKKLRTFLIGDDGPTAVEYAIMLSMVVSACVISIKGVGSNSSGAYSKVASSLDGGSASAGSGSLAKKKGSGSRIE